MKTLGRSAAVATLCVAFASVGHAQSQPPSANTVEQPAETPQMSGSGTAPENMGTTGWTGGSRGTSKQPHESSNPEDPVNQPWVATGKDLKGPPAQFPANKTPE